MAEAISREIAYQNKRGYVAKLIQVSPEAHEVLRMDARAPQGALLQEHDGVPVRIWRKLIGPKVFRIIYDRVGSIPEKVIDRARLGAL